MRTPWWRAQNGHWYVNLHGKQHRLTEEPDPDGGGRKAPPRHVEDAWHKLVQRGEPKDLKIREIFRRFKEACANPHHARSVAFMLGQFEAYLGGDFRLPKLRPFHLTEFLKSRTTWGPATQRTAVNRIHAAINYAVREGLIEKNPITSTPGYKRQGYYTKRKGVVDPSLRQRLEEAANPALRAILVALRESGCRPGELRKALIERCFLDAGVMFVPNKTARATGEAERAIYLSDGLKVLLRKLIGVRTEGFIFLTAHGKPWSYTNLEERWQVLKEKVPVPVPKGVTLYAYRRTCISTALNEKNVNPALVAQLVGHVGLDMLLKHYAQEDPEALRRAVQAVTKRESATQRESTP
jgi:integrase